MAERRALIVGLGNPSRRDDGLGRYVVNEVRRCRGQRELSPYEDGLDEEGGVVDSVLLPQLAYEVAELAAGYDTLVVVDARVSGGPTVSVERVDPEVRPPSRMLSHDMHPSEIIALCRALFGRAPETFVVSLAGVDYDFGTGLSPEVEARLPSVVDAVLGLIDPSGSSD